MCMHIKVCIVQLCSVCFSNSCMTLSFKSYVITIDPNIKDHRMYLDMGSRWLSSGSFPNWFKSILLTIENHHFTITKLI